MSLLLILSILSLHWIFDFLLQTDKMALNKSKSLSYLIFHSSVYSLWSIPISLLFNLPPSFIVYVFLTHTLIDGITSRITSYLWKKNKLHYFFTVIGFDQLLHYATIFWYLSLFPQCIQYAR